MPYKDKKAHNKWRLDQYYKRREAAMWLLGEKCTYCNSTSNLHFDHIDPTKKSFPIGRKLHTAPWQTIYWELQKCQLLCELCHRVKTINDNGGPITHGNYSYYKHRGCRCDACKKANAAYSRKYKKEYNRRSFNG